jgi:hypothetical protein
MESLLFMVKPSIAEVLVLLKEMVVKVRELDEKLDELRTDPRLTRVEEKVFLMQWVLGVCFTSVVGQIVYLVIRR